MILIPCLDIPTESTSLNQSMTRTNSFHVLTIVPWDNGTPTKVFANVYSSLLTLSSQVYMMPLDTCYSQVGGIDSCVLLTWRKELLIKVLLRLKKLLGHCICSEDSSSLQVKNQQLERMIWKPASLKNTKTNIQAGSHAWPLSNVLMRKAMSKQRGSFRDQTTAQWKSGK